MAYYIPSVWKSRRMRPPCPPPNCTHGLNRKWVIGKKKVKNHWSKEKLYVFNLLEYAAHSSLMWNNNVSMHCYYFLVFDATILSPKREKRMTHVEALRCASMIFWTHHQLFIKLGKKCKTKWLWQVSNYKITFILSSGGYRSILKLHVNRTLLTQ